MFNDVMYWFTQHPIVFGFGLGCLAVLGIEAALVGMFWLYMMWCFDAFKGGG